ncbi:chloride channel protein [Paraconexibacter antarcticus]|uniref:Chloride channel protein n=1 Tax=Paraconexibacter antarcticus TaxID=2949664 RepID=A0ABY5DPB3_9ACTN|nr:chloride channel protein [Paraconexibacter antarcticus]UTI63043.1 chloride channel protein [Paraconexibacter antarcticus]
MLDASLSLPTPRARLSAWARTSDRPLIAMALLIGLGGGVGAVLFRELIIGITRLVTGREDYAGLGRVASTHAHWLGPWFLLLAPVLGGLFYGPLLARFAPEARGHGVPEVMLAVARQGGRIRPRVAVVKAFASAACIGTGGSVGREGPIVQIGSALGSALGQLADLPERHLRTLVACGAAAGISATFNTPIAGVFFAMEVILRRVDASSFGLPVVSSVAAAAVGRAAFGDKPFLTLPAVHVASVADYALFAGLGVLATLAGLGFVRILYGTEDLAERLWRGPAWARPVAGGLLLGLLLLALPEMYGVGYPVLSRVVEGHDALALVLLLMVAKAVATSTTIAIGGSGGVFAPSLFIGAMLGSAYGRTAHALLGGGLIAASSAYGVVGMGAVFAACARAPMTAVLILFELTGDPGVILPAMLAIATTVALADAITKDTIYTLKLRRRGIDIDAPAGERLLAGLRVPAPAPGGPAPVRWDRALTDLAGRFADTGTSTLAVMGPDRQFEGIVTLTDVEQHLDADDVAHLTAGTVLRPAPTVHQGDALHELLDALAQTGVESLPIFDRSTAGAPTGWLGSADVLALIRGPDRTLPTPVATGASAAREAQQPPGPGERFLLPGSGEVAQGGGDGGTADADEVPERLVRERQR